MHAITPHRHGRSSWQAELGQAHARLDDLLAALGLTAEACGVSTEAAAAFPLRVPRGFVARMRYGDPADPLLRQVLPVDAENTVLPGFGTDPVGDLDSVLAPGLLQKYAGRALLITTGACAVHCRYCFRRAFPYAGHSATPGCAGCRARRDCRRRQPAGNHPERWRSARARQWPAARTHPCAGCGIPHIARIRLHTRLPVVLPERIDDELLELLRNAGKAGGNGDSRQSCPGDRCRRRRGAR